MAKNRHWRFIVMPFPCNARAVMTDRERNKAAPAGWHGLILAAARGPDDPMAKAFGVRHKCLLPVAGEPMLRRVVRALRESARVDDISIVIDDERAARQALGELARRVRFLPPAASAAASATRALEELMADGRAALVTSGDHPLLTAAMIARMAEAAAREPDADLLIAFARREVVEAAWPHVRRTWLRFADVSVTSCNLFLFASRRAVAAARFWREVEKNRKRPWRIVRAFGLRPLLKFLLNRLRLNEALRLAGERLGLRARAVFLDMPEAAVDVDKPEDLALVERILREQASGRDAP